MFSILFIAACWILIPWLAASTTIPLPLLLLLILPVLVVAADYLQP
jgi:hypothetical protein